MDGKFCSVAIYLYGDFISLDGASKLMGLSPTRSRNKGDSRITSSGSEVIQKIGFWEYRVKVPAEKVDSCLTGILNAVECNGLVGEAGISKAEIDIFYPLDTGDVQDGISMEMPCKLLKKLAFLGFDLIITVR
ncbi:hypothetical protein ACWKWK_18415 [Pseudoxanthomonas beigongshangi]